MIVTMWKEIGACFQHASEDENIRVIIFSGKGDVFTTGKVKNTG